MKIVLSILCSLMLVWTPVAMAAAPATCAVTAGQPMMHCCCRGMAMNGGCAMKCCGHASASQPLAATTQAGLQNQVLSPVPAVVVWVWATAGTTSVSASVSPSLQTAFAPLFARNCAWLI